MTQGGPGRFGEFRILIAQAGEHGCQHIGRDLMLAQQPAAARSRIAFRIALLIIVDSMRQRHQQRRPSDHAQLGNRRCAGPAEHQMRRRHAPRQIAEKLLNVMLDAELFVFGLDRLDVLRPALLRDLDLAARADREARRPRAA